MKIKSILILAGLLVAFPGAAMDSFETSNAGGLDPADFPTQAFSFRKCSEGIPVNPKKNPWLKTVKKKTKQAPMDPTPPSLVESYYVTPAHREKRFAIINQQDSIYSSPTSLARIDCKHGLVYFQQLVREPIPTNYYRVYDLLSGEEYRVVEGAVTISPDGSHLMTASASDRDQKCGRAPTCELAIALYQCKPRKAQGAACVLQAEKKYRISRQGKATNFSPLPLKWNWNKHKKVLKASLGGSSVSPGKINCSVLPKFSCSVAKKGGLEFTEK